MPQNHQVAQKTKNQLASNLNPAAGGAAEQPVGQGCWIMGRTQAPDILTAACLQLDAPENVCFCAEQRDLGRLIQKVPLQ